MIGIRASLLAAALAAGIAAGGWGLWLKSQLSFERLTTKGLVEKLDTAQTDARINLATANKLKSELASERASQAKLLALQGELRQGLAQRERVIEALKHENQQLREWADQPLPDAARRLRERPALTGADAYRQWLSGSRPVPATGDGTSPQRPVAH